MRDVNSCRRWDVTAAWSGEQFAFVHHQAEEELWNFACCKIMRPGGCAVGINVLGTIETAAHSAFLRHEIIEIRSENLLLAFPRQEHCVLQLEIEEFITYMYNKIINPPIRYRNSFVHCSADATNIRFIGMQFQL